MCIWDSQIESEITHLMYKLKQSGVKMNVTLNKEMKYIVLITRANRFFTFSFRILANSWAKPVYKTFQLSCSFCVHWWYLIDSTACPRETDRRPIELIMPWPWTFKDNSMQAHFRFQPFCLSNRLHFAICIGHFKSIQRRWKCVENTCATNIGHALHAMHFQIHLHSATFSRS